MEDACDLDQRSGRSAVVTSARPRRDRVVVREQEDRIGARRSAIALTGRRRDPSDDVVDDRAVRRAVAPASDVHLRIEPEPAKLQDEAVAERVVRRPLDRVRRAVREQSPEHEHGASCRDLPAWSVHAARLGRRDARVHQGHVTTSAMSAATATDGTSLGGRTKRRWITRSARLRGR